MDDFYAYWEGKALLNYGANVSHPFARLKVLDGFDPGGRGLYGDSMGRAMNDGQQWKTKIYDPDDEATIMAAVETEIERPSNDAFTCEVTNIDSPPATTPSSIFIFVFNDLRVI